MKVLRFLPFLTLAVIAAIVLSGFGARLGVWDFRVGFQILLWATYAGLAIAAVALVALLVRNFRSGRVRTLAISLVMAFGAAALPLYWLQLARTLPAINDITTDTAHPPPFVTIAALRANAPVPTTYPGDATAKAQRAAYPDLQPRVVAREPAAAFEAALSAARQMGWDVVGADVATGRIEATASTPWFGFNDDVVIRIMPAEGGSRIDIRSVSRVGKGDLGANARRIRAFLAKVAP